MPKSNCLYPFCNTVSLCIPLHHEGSHCISARCTLCSFCKSGLRWSTSSTLTVIFSTCDIMRVLIMDILCAWHFCPWTDSIFKLDAVSCLTFLSCWISVVSLYFLLPLPPPSSNGSSVYLPDDVEQQNVCGHTLFPAHAILTRLSLTAVMLMEKASGTPDTEWPHSSH